MKILYLICFVLFTVNISICQVGFLEHEVPHDINMSLDNMFYSDIDGDGDIDIITTFDSNGDDDRIFWHENLNGLGDFGTEKLINGDARDPRSPIAADFDGDGDVDFAGISFEFSQHIYWQENEDGLGDFGDAAMIDGLIQNPREIIAADIDNDGDMDILLVCGSFATSSVPDNLILYKNNGSGNFIKQVISTSHDHTYIVACDIDNDDDLDLVCSNAFGGSVYWYENIDGQTSFADGVSLSEGIGTSSLSVADFDGDADLDILVTTDNGYNVQWFENEDGQGGSFINHTVEGLNSFQSLEAIPVDIDGDGDMDIVSMAAEWEYDLVWYENVDGLGVFSENQLVHSGLYNPRDILAADFNADGKMDIGAVSLVGDVVVGWYENLGLQSNIIKGYVSLDDDVNGCDDNDYFVPNLKIVADNGSHSLATFTLSNGYFQMFPQIGEYTVSINSPVLDYYSSSPEQHVHSFVDIGSIEQGDFCLQPISEFSDLIISIYPLGPARPGFNNSYLLTYQNIGSTTLSGTASFEYNNEMMTFLNSDTPVSSQATGVLNFDFELLLPLESKLIIIDFNTSEPPTVNQDDILNFTATISPIATDNTPEDNIYTMDQVVLAALDPNDIKAVEGEEVLIGDKDNYLHYIIRFQNVGSFYATFIRIEEELSELLDWESFQLESTSHDCRIEIENGSDVRFYFDAIYLPGEDDEPNSHGYVTYKIKPKSNVQIGDIISSQAFIFFDYNLPIETNIDNVEFVEYVDLNDNINVELELFPVPTHDIIIIKSDQNIKELIFYNELGQSFKRELINRQIDISDFKEGIYFVKWQNEDGSFVIKKIIKY